MKNLLISLIVMASLFMAGCPKKAYKTAKEQSAKIQTYGNELKEVNNQGFKTGKLTPEQYAELTILTGRFRDAVEVFNKVLNEAEKQVTETGKIEVSLFNRLEKLFNNEVVEAFLAVRQKLNVFAPVQSETVSSILAGINLSILAIQGAFAEARAIVKKPPTP